MLVSTSFTVVFLVLLLMYGSAYYKFTSDATPSPVPSSTPQPICQQKIFPSTHRHSCQHLTTREKPEWTLGATTGDTRCQEKKRVDKSARVWAVVVTSSTQQHHESKTIMA